MRPLIGRGDPGVNQLQLGVVDLPLVELDGALELAHQGLLGVILLFGDGILAGQDPVALQVHLGVLQQGLVPDHLPLGLGQLRLIGPRVDFRQELPLA